MTDKVKVLKDTREGWERLVQGALMNMHNDEQWGTVAWGIVSDGLGVGSTHATEICRHFGYHPFMEIPHMGRLVKE